MLLKRLPTRKSLSRRGVLVDAMRSMSRNHISSLHVALKAQFGMECSSG